MVKGNRVDTNAPEDAASAMPMANAKASTMVEEMPISSAASRLSATARMALPGRARYRNSSSANAMMTAAVAAAMWFPAKVESRLDNWERPITQCTEIQ